MIPNNTARKVDTAGLTQGAGFTIRASAQAFKILSSGLYTDKPRAIIRELAANAWDSQIAAGTDHKPFTVTLPTSLSPILKVRDFGTGMSHDALLTLYTTYFGSDKDHTNDLIGGMGLGSKSPLSYTDSFTVISWHGHHKRTYNVYVDARGAPNITLLDDETSLEHTGMEIQIPVKPDEFYLFQYAATKTLQWFPRVTLHNSYSALEPVKYSLKTPEFGITTAVERPHLVMGNIAYPINMYLVCKDNTLDSLRSLNLVLFAPIGSAEPAASREELSYTPETIDWITRALTRVQAQIVESAHKNVMDQPDLWSAQQAWFNVPAPIRELIRKAIGKRTVTDWRSIAIEHQGHTLTDTPSVSIPPHELGVTSLKMAKVHVNTKKDVAYANFSLSQSIIYLNDLDDRQDAIRRIKATMANNSSRDYQYLIEQDWYDRHKVDVLRNRPVLKVSELPEVVPEKTARRGNSRPNYAPTSRPTRLKLVGLNACPRKIMSDDPQLKDNPLLVVKTHNRQATLRLVSEKDQISHTATYKQDILERIPHTLANVLPKYQNHKLLIVPASKSLPRGLDPTPVEDAIIEMIVAIKNDPYLTREWQSHLTGWNQHTYSEIDRLKDKTTASKPLTDWINKRDFWREKQRNLLQASQFDNLLNLRLLAQPNPHDRTLDAQENMFALRYAPLILTLRNRAASQHWPDDKIIKLINAVEKLQS